MNELTQRGFATRFSGMLRTGWAGGAPSIYTTPGTAMAACVTAHRDGYSFIRAVGSDWSVVSTMRDCATHREDCWDECHEELQQGGDCASFCGSGRSCCREGVLMNQTTNACHGGTIGCTDYHCCTDNPSPPLPPVAPPGLPGPALPALPPSLSWLPATATQQLCAPAANIIEAAAGREPSTAVCTPFYLDESMSVFPHSDLVECFERYNGVSPGTAICPRDRAQH